MARVARILAGVLLLLAAAAGGRPAPDTDEPHGFMQAVGRCGGCHEVKGPGVPRADGPRSFTGSVVAICRECHRSEEMGRSHPVGMDPARSRGRVQVPPELPLHWSDERGSEVMTCGTCHNPHLARFTDRRIHSFQKPHPQGKGRFLTYYLRLRGDEPKDGYTPLCRACHPKL